MQTNSREEQPCWISMGQKYRNARNSTNGAEPQKSEMCVTAGHALLGLFLVLTMTLLKKKI